MDQAFTGAFGPDLPRKPQESQEEIQLQAEPSKLAEKQCSKTLEKFNIHFFQDLGLGCTSKGVTRSRELPSPAKKCVSKKENSGGISFGAIIATILRNQLCKRIPGELFSRKLRKFRVIHSGGACCLSGHQSPLILFWGINFLVST